MMKIRFDSDFSLLATELDAFPGVSSHSIKLTKRRGSASRQQSPSVRGSRARAALMRLDCTPDQPQSTQRDVIETNPDDDV